MPPGTDAGTEILAREEETTQFAVEPRSNTSPCWAITELSFVMVQDPNKNILEKDMCDRYETNIKDIALIGLTLNMASVPYYLHKVVFHLDKREETQE